MRRAANSASTATPASTTRAARSPFERAPVYSRDICPAVARKRYWSWLVTATWWPSTTGSGPLPWWARYGW